MGFAIASSFEGIAFDGRIDEDGNKVMKIGKRYVLVGTMVEEVESIFHLFVS